MKISALFGITVCTALVIGAEAQNDSPRAGVRG